MGFQQVEVSMLPHTHLAGFSLSEGPPVDSDSKTVEDRMNELVGGVGGQRRQR